MWYSKRYDHTQIKVNKQLKDRARDIDFERMINGKDGRPKSWSATMPAYYGTRLCPKKEDWGKGNE